MHTRASRLDVVLAQVGAASLSGYASRYKTLAKNCYFALHVHCVSCQIRCRGCHSHRRLPPVRCYLPCLEWAPLTAAPTANSPPSPPSCLQAAAPSSPGGVPPGGAVRCVLALVGRPAAECQVGMWDMTQAGGGRWRAATWRMAGLRVDDKRGAVWGSCGCCTASAQRMPNWKGMTNLRQGWARGHVLRVRVRRLSVLKLLRAAPAVPVLRYHASQCSCTARPRAGC